MMQRGAGGDSVLDIACAAQRASLILATTSADQRNDALINMASALRQQTEHLVAENAIDMDQARKAGTTEGLLDRLMLDDSRIDSMATALEDLAGLPDPLGTSQRHEVLKNGLDLTRISVPLGVVAMVYEARPNVAADAAGICIKTGNACVLRGGSMALHSSIAIAHVLQEAAFAAGMPDGCIGIIETADRAATDELMSLHGIIDVLIPRGGAGLIQHCVEHSRVPVIETGTGNCHIYVHEAADFAMARALVMNAKCRRTGVCNAAEGLLVDASIAGEFLPLMLAELNERGVVMHVDEAAGVLARAAGIEGVLAATEQDWATEYLALELSIKCVSGLEEAIDHINCFGTKHSEAIVTANEQAAARFCAAVDAAAVYVNASTAFTDGAEFGMGAEIGISTQKLHARGPFALEALTSYKYLLKGSGQVRA